MTTEEDFQDIVNLKVRNKLGEKDVTIAVLEARVETYDRRVLELQRENAELQKQVELMAERIEAE